MLVLSISGGKQRILNERLIKLGLENRFRNFEETRTVTLGGTRKKIYIGAFFCEMLYFDQLCHILVSFRVCSCVQIESANLFSFAHSSMPNPGIVPYSLLSAAQN